MARGQNNNDNRNLEEADSNSHGWLWGFKEVTADIVETARELEFEVEPEDVTELLWFHEKTWMNEELLLMHEQRKWFPEMASAPRKYAIKVIEMTTKDSEYDTNSGEKAAAWFKRTDSNPERSSTTGKMLSNSTACYRNHSSNSQKQCGKLHCCLILRYGHNHPNLQPSPPK